MTTLVVLENILTMLQTISPDSICDTHYVPTTAQMHWKIFWKMRPHVMTDPSLTWPRKCCASGNNIRRWQKSRLSHLQKRRTCDFNVNRRPTVTLCGSLRPFWQDLTIWLIVAIIVKGETFWKIILTIIPYNFSTAMKELDLFENR